MPGIKKISKAATKHGIKTAKRTTKSLAKRGGLGVGGAIASKLFGGRSKKSKIRRAARKAAGAKKGSGVGKAALKAHRAAKRAKPAKVAPKARRAPAKRKTPVRTAKKFAGAARAAAGRTRRGRG